MRRIAFALTLAAVPSLVFAQEVRRADLPADVPSILNHPHNWDGRTCTLGWTRLEIIEAPRHGTLTIGSGLYEIGDYGGGRQEFGGTTGCEGQVVDGAQLIYNPEDGFVGADAFSYRILSEFGPSFERSYAVRVGG